MDNELLAPTGDSSVRRCVLVAVRSRTLADALVYAFEQSGYPALSTRSDDAFEGLAGEQISTVVVDADGDREAAIERIKKMRHRIGDVDVILLVGERGPATHELVEQTGALGFVTRDVDPLRFVKAVISPCHLPECKPAARKVSRGDVGNPLAILTERQREVLAELLTGGSDTQIAVRLGVSANTIRTHIQNVFLKLGVKTRFEAAATALQAGLRSPVDSQR